MDDYNRHIVLGRCHCGSSWDLPLWQSSHWTWSLRTSYSVSCWVWGKGGRRKHNNNNIIELTWKKNNQHQTTAIHLKGFSFLAVSIFSWAFLIWIFIFYFLSKMKDKELNQCFVLCSKYLGSLVGDTEQAAAYKPRYCLRSSNQRGHLLLPGYSTLLRTFVTTWWTAWAPLRYLAMVTLVILTCYARSLCQG